MESGCVEQPVDYIVEAPATAVVEHRTYHVAREIIVLETRSYFFGLDYAPGVRHGDKLQVPLLRKTRAPIFGHFPADGRPGVGGRARGVVHGRGAVVDRWIVFNGRLLR